MRIVQGANVKAKKRKGLCLVHKCMTAARSKVHKFCHKHARQFQKETNPLRYWYDVFKQHSRQRKIENHVTIEEFKDFCDETKYLELKGRKANNATIDRIKSHLPYTRDNMQVLKNRTNVRKMHVDRMLRAKYGSGETITAEELDEIKDTLTESNGANVILWNPETEDYF